MLRTCVWCYFSLHVSNLLGGRSPTSKLVALSCFFPLLNMLLFIVEDLGSLYISVEKSMTMGLGNHLTIEQSLQTFLSTLCLILLLKLTFYAPV